MSGNGSRCQRQQSGVIALCCGFVPLDAGRPWTASVMTGMRQIANRGV